MKSSEIQEHKHIAITQHIESLSHCKQCPAMIGPVVTGKPVISRVMLVGQAPGSKEGEFGKPFAWTAGKTLFRWLATLGVDEQEFRDRAYMAAVCRCFPGKGKTGGDRVPAKDEIEKCSSWLIKELQIVDPDLIIPVGKLAIEQFIEFDKLTDVIGQKHRISLERRERLIIPLPHPSGASTWFKKDPGKTLTENALALIGADESFRLTFQKGRFSSE